MSTTALSRRRLLAIATLAPLALLGACAGEDALSGTASGGESSGGAGGKVVIAGQNFTEMQLMTEMYAAVLKDAGYDVDVKLVESRDVYAPQLQKGAVDVSADYLSSMTEYLNKQANGPDAEVVASPDTDATFAVTEQFAQENDLKTLSDLAALGKPITLAAAEDCSQRTDCEIGLEKTYGLDITKVEPLGFGSTGTKDALTKGEVDLGQVGTSDATLEQLGLVILEDDKDLQNAENLVPMVNSDFIDANPDVADLLDEMSAGLSTEDLATMIGKVDLERQLPEDVAREYLTEEGLI